jgi:flagellar motor switch protein FliN/FliY
MPEHDKAIASTFLEAWSPEFAKSVEMFTGLSVSVQASGEGKPEHNIAEDRSILWQTQTIECGLTGSVWIGAPAATRSALTETLAEDAASRESLYRELLRQSLEGAAHVLSPGPSQRMVCKKALEDGSPPPDLAEIKTAWINLPGREAAPILVGFQWDFVALMLAVEHESAVEQAMAERPAPPKEAAPVSNGLFDRLVDLELPIAVVLGRARVRVQDAIKLTAGSLVELDRRSGDSVEIVVHNAVVARGEVVSVGGNYGVKIREVISRQDREALQMSVSSSGRGTLQR